MANKDDYSSVTQEIASYFNAYSLAFKTYQIGELEKMIKVKAGEGARLSTTTVSEQFELMLLKRGFMCFPPIASAEDGYTRIFRTGTAAANILQAFLNPGPTGDEALKGLLRRLYNPQRSDVTEGDEEIPRGR